MQLRKALGTAFFRAPGALYSQALGLPLARALGLPVARASGAPLTRALGASLLVLALAPASYAADKKPQFFPSVQAPVERGPVGDSFTFSTGFFFSGIAPGKNPFAEVDSGNASAFRYQVPSSFGVEATFAILRWLEVGASAEYLHFSSSFVSKTTNNTRAETVGFKSFPIKLLVRGIFNIADGFAFESEVAGGYSTGKASVSSSDQGTAATTVKNTVKSFAGHAAVGVGFIWDDTYSIHTLVGYGVQTLGNNRYNNAVYDVLQDGNFMGPFGKVLLRYQF